MGIIINAGLILADGETLVRSSAVRIKRNTIVEIDSFDRLRRGNPGDEIYDFPGAAILPGFTNAHCHLELDWCEGRISYNGNFLDWLQSIRDIKFGANPPVPNPFPSIAKMFMTGTTTLIDHYVMPMPTAKIYRTGLRYYPLKEMFEFNNHSPNPSEIARRTAFSFAVHSPYTTSKEIAVTCRRLADRWGRPLSTHISEMKDEIEFIRSGNEHVEKLLRKSNTYDESWRGLGKTPIEYFYKLGLLNTRTYGVHINYWEDNDLYYLSSSGLTPVFCPKSHRYFKHPRHPIEDYLRVGLKVALGTDSLASNDALNMLQEARLAVNEHPGIQMKDILDSITVNGLRPLGLHTRLGKIAHGRIADLTVWDSIKGDTPDEVIHEVIMHREATLLTMVNGVVRHLARV